MQVIGLCRFSYPAYGGFQVEHDTIQDRMAWLYAPTRMEERFRLFETVTLPCLKEQTDGDFDFAIVIGDSLPQQHQDRLRDLTAGMDQVQIISEPPRQAREVMKAVINSVRHDPDAPCLQFRHDDDDAVSVDFVERLRTAAGDCAGLLAKSRTVTFDWNRGYSAMMGPDGISATETFRPYFGVALAMYVGPGVTNTIMNFAHHKMHRFMPSVTFTDAPMYVRSINDFNDSRQANAKEIELTPLTPEQKGEFIARFGIDADHVRSVFSAPVPGTS